MSKLLSAIKTATRVVVFIVLVPFILVARLIFNKPVDLSPSEVLDYLKRMHAGEIDEYWWDDFLNIPIKDAELDKIRARCEDVWCVESDFLEWSPDDGSYKLSQKGLGEISRLISRCHELSET